MDALLGAVLSLRERGELEPFLAREVGAIRANPITLPGCGGGPFEVSLVERIQRRAAFESLAVSSNIQQLARTEIRLDE